MDTLLLCFWCDELASWVNDSDATYCDHCKEEYDGMDIQWYRIVEPDTAIVASDAHIIEGYAALEAAQLAAAEVRREKELIDRFIAALDAWADSDANAHLKPTTLSMLFDCDGCGSGGRFVQGEVFVSDDRAFFCPTCWASLTAPAPAPSATSHVRCSCERDSASLQVYYADRFNEALGLATTDDVGNCVPGDEYRHVPEWVRLRAATVEANCPAAVHFGSVLLDEWLGNDVLTSDDKRKRAQLVEEDERLQLQASLTDAARPRWASEHDSYVDQHEFIEQLTVQRRNMLIRLIRACGGDPNLPETIAWVQDAITKKHGNRLRGYARCIYLLQRKIESGEIQVSA